MTTVGITHTGVFFPPEIETAKEIAVKAEIPEAVIVEKFGLVQKARLRQHHPYV